MPTAAGERLMKSSRSGTSRSQPSAPVSSRHAVPPLKIIRYCGFSLSIMVTMGSMTMAASTRLAANCVRASAKLACTTETSVPSVSPLERA